MHVFARRSACNINAAREDVVQAKIVPQEKRDPEVAVQADSSSPKIVCEECREVAPVDEELQDH